MKLLLTNDDGIEAPGLATLEKILASRGEVTVVAPSEPLSGCSHQVSMDHPLRLHKLGPGRYAVDGTPADCTRLALLHVVPDVDWVVAGINDGGNLGVDVYMSGTVAAVREAALLGKPGLAISQFRRKAEPFQWEQTVPLVNRVLEELWPQATGPSTFWNVNLPHLNGQQATPQIVSCPLDSRHLCLRYELQDGRFHYRSNYEQRPRTPGTDVDVCFSGHISVTQLRLDGTA